MPFTFKHLSPNLRASFVVSLFVFNWVLPYILQVLIASAILFYPGLILIDHGHFQYPLTFCQRKVLIYSLLYPSSKYKGGSRTQKKYRDKQILSYFLCKFFANSLSAVNLKFFFITTPFYYRDLLHFLQACGWHIFSYLNVKIACLYSLIDNDVMMRRMTMMSMMMMMMMMMMTWT